jgi:hypothetical protein
MCTALGRFADRAGATLDRSHAVRSRPYTFVESSAEMPEDALGIDVPEEESFEEEVKRDALVRAATEAGWPFELETSLDTLRQVQPDRVVNAKQLGDLAFTEAPDQLAAITQVLTDLRLEAWGDIPPELATQVVNIANSTIEALRQMAQLRAAQPDSQSQHDALDAQLRSSYDFFVMQVRPHCFNAKVATVLEKRRDLLSHGLSEDRIMQLQKDVSGLKAEVEEFQSLSDLISAQRELLGAKGVSKLSADFKTLADESAKAFKNWHGV